MVKNIIICISIEIKIKKIKFWWYCVVLVLFEVGSLVGLLVNENVVSINFLYFDNNDLSVI